MKTKMTAAVCLFLGISAFAQQVPADTLQTKEKNIEQVVITALGIKKDKKAVGYAVQEVSGDKLEKAKESNLVSSLAGRVSGLTIKNTSDLFQNPGIDLRGNEPLIVIDGIPDRTADLFKVSSDDVESISVLKGPTASALYGSVGRHGAILISTKKGKKRKTQISFNNSTMFQTSFIRIPNVQTTYGGGGQGIYKYVDGSGSGSEGGGWIWGPKLDQRDPTTSSGFFETTQFDSPVDPVTGKLIPTPWISRGKNNLKNFFETGVIQSNNISVEWGQEKSSFRVSLSNMYQKGIVPNTNLKTTGISLGGSLNPVEKLTINTNLTYNKEYTNNFPEIGYGPTNYLYNLVLWTGADVDITKLRNYWQPGKEGFQQRNYNLSYYNNPYFQAYEYLRPYFKDNIYGNISADYKLLPNLTLKTRVGFNGYALDREYKEPKSYIGYGKKSLGNYTQAKENYLDVTSEAGLRFEKNFSDNFQLNAEAFYSNFYRELKSSTQMTDGLIVPGLYTFTNNASSNTTGTNWKEYELINSFYGYADLAFYDMLFVTITGRNDKISTLAKGNNSYFYPSASVSLLLNKMMKMPDFINLAKIRSSWARVTEGKLKDGPYAYIPAYERGTPWAGQPAFNYQNTLIESSIKPESTDAWEIGATLSFLRNRFSVDFAYFVNKDYNQQIKVPLSNVTGYNSMLVNGDVFSRKGYEVTVDAAVVKTQDFGWNAQINLSGYQRYIKEFYGSEESRDGMKVGDNAAKILEWQYQTSPDGKLILQDGYPVWMPVKTPIGGNTTSDMTFGLSQSFRYKNISLSLLFDGRIGGYMYSVTDYKMWYSGKHPGEVNQYRDDANAGLSNYVVPGVKIVSGSAEYDNFGNITKDTRVFAPNDVPINYISYMQSNGAAYENNYHYFKQDFIKLREVVFTYNFNKDFLRTFGMSDASLSLIGRNLFLASKIKNVDPDSGQDNLQTPSTRSIGLNLNIKF